MTYSPLNLLISILVCLACLSLSSCSRSYFYAPSDGYVVGLDEAGDLKVSGGIGRLAKNRSFWKRRSFSYQVAYSPIKNWGIQGSLTQVMDDSWTLSKASPSSAQIGEFVVGHYTLKRKDKEKALKEFEVYTRFENYIGLGWGKVNFQLNSSNFSEIYYQKFIFQTGFSIVFHPYFEINLALRPTYVKYDRAEVIGSLDVFQQQDIDRLKGNDAYFFPETSLRLQSGNEKFRVFISTSNLLIDYKKYRDLFHSNDPLLQAPLSAGLSFDLNKLFRKNKNKKIKTVAD